MGRPAEIREARTNVQKLCAAPLWLQSDAEARETVAEALALKAAADALYLEAMRDLDARPDAVPGARAGKTAVTFAREKLHRSRAAADVDAAHALHDDLPRLGAALVAGEVSREHVDVAVRTLKRVPRQVREVRRAEIDAWFTATSRDQGPVQTDVLARHLLEVLDPDGSDTFDPRAVERRDLSVTRDATGMVVIRGQLDAGGAAPFLAALDYLSKPWPRDEGGLPVPDERTKGQRQADGLTLMGRLTLGGIEKGAEVDRPRVTIQAPLSGPVAECDQTGPLSQPWLAMFLCDATLEAALIGRTGEVLNLGRSVRTATTHQRRALIARDGGCVIPGCHAPGAWCDAHHATWWSKGGATDVANLAMLCGRHHAAVHSGVWAVEMRDGVPWARPPTWIDPHQQWIRNTYQHHRNQARQLRLDLDPPPDNGNGLAAA